MSGAARRFTLINGNGNIAGVRDAVSEIFQLLSQAGSAQDMWPESGASAARSQFERDPDDSYTGRRCDLA